MAPHRVEELTAAAPGVTLGNRYFDVVVSRGGFGSVVLKESRTNLFATDSMAANAISYSTLDGRGRLRHAGAVHRRRSNSAPCDS